jgi:predicted nucleic acid-binding Zn ribbon protein
MRVEYIRKRVLQDWRGLPDAPDRPERCITAADALKKLLPKLGLTERLNEQEVQSAWREIVGDFLAEHSLPVSMKGGVVIVQVLQPTVRYELDRTWKPEILRKLKSRFGAKTIREVRFRG